MNDTTDTVDGQIAEYRVLARKYRPSNFDDLIGQEPMVRTLTNAFASNRIAQAYMLTGVRGVGKTTTARILARALNYQSDKIGQPTLDLFEPGDHCPSIMEGNHIDVIEMDAASHTGIGDIREIIASVQYKPVSARYKVYIIDEVHMLSSQAFNGLLKTLEEPPEHVKFIFATTEIRKVPITVLSRCQRFDLRRIDAGELTTHLDKIAGLEGVEAENEALAMIARAGEGSVRDCLSMLDQAIAHSSGSGDGKVLAASVRNMLGLADRARVIDLFEHMMKGDIAAALAEIKEQYDVGADPATVLTDLAGFVHFVTRVMYVDTALDDPSLSEVEKTRGKEFADKLSPRILGRAWQMLLKGIAEVQSSSRPLAAADMVLIRLTHAADLPTPDEVLKSLANNPDTHGGSTPKSTGANGSTPSASSPSTTSKMTQLRGLPGDGAGRHQSVRRHQSVKRRQSVNGPTLVVSHDPQQADKPETAKANHLKAMPDVTPALQAFGPAFDSAFDPAFDKVTSLDDLLAMAEKKRDIRFKLLLRNNFSAISFEPGKIEFKPVGDAPGDMARQLGERLHEWTGNRWEIVASQDEGAATIRDVEVAAREKHFSDAENDPVVAAVLKAFPRSKILDVRFPGLESEDGLDDASVQEAALENPDSFEAGGDSDNQPAGGGEADDSKAGALNDYFN